MNITFQFIKGHHPWAFGNTEQGGAGGLKCLYLLSPLWIDHHIFTINPHVWSCIISVQQKNFYSVMVMEGFATMYMRMPMSSSTLPIQGTCTVDDKKVSLKFPFTGIEFDLPSSPKEDRNDFDFKVRYSGTVVGESLDCRLWLWSVKIRTMSAGYWIGFYDFINTLWGIVITCPCSHCIICQATADPRYGDNYPTCSAM